ncbi:MAG TPA: hypothetical protein VIE88_03960 [Vicinamibacteria bacterium]
MTDTAVRADFLELAFLGERAIYERGAFRFSLVAGPQVGLRLRARRRFDVDQDVTGELREADLKIVCGLRLARRLGEGAVFVEGRFGCDLTDLDDTKQNQIHSRAIWIQLGYAP